MMRLPKVTAIILNTNRRDDTLECLASLERCSYPNLAIILLDNASTDGSVEAIQARFPGVQIIHLSENRGYAGNNNIGVKVALDQGADWVLVLNEDTILDPECVIQLIEVGESDPEIGIVGPMVYHFDEPEAIQSAGGMFDRYWHVYHRGKDEIDRGQFKETHPVGYISGCAIMLRAELIKQVGGIDERFFYYFEETEWCVRASRAGWKIIHVPKAKVWHKGVQRNYSPSPNVTYYSTRNWLLLLKTHKAPFRAWLHVWLYLFKLLVVWSIKPKYRTMATHRQAVWNGMVDFVHSRWGKMACDQHAHFDLNRIPGLRTGSKRSLDQIQPRRPIKKSG